MLLSMFLWNVLIMKDIVYYQQCRYQKDRYRMNLKITKLDLICLVCNYSMTFILYMNQQLFLFYLLFLLVLPTLFKKCSVYIKELIVTKRIARLFIILGLFNSMFFMICFISEWIGIFILFLFLIFHSHLFYVFILITHPIEMRIRKKYAMKAKKKLENFKGIKIGITGSYGKTSIKNLVADVLSMKYSCLKTRGSYNNEMGITKTILEEMSNQEIFICEMGADHLHEIEDLCAFVKPHHGIVSSIGPQHLSTFKSIENIFHEKVQLLESLPQEGIGLYNFDNHHLHHLDTEGFSCRCFSVGIQTSAQFQAIHLQVDHLGSQFDVILDGKRVHFSTMLLGEHNILNCLFAISLAHLLKVEDMLIQLAIAASRPTPHRLELKPFYHGMCIDNAYNSNPESAKCALEVLKMMPGKHFVITPGFLDLGEHHDYYSIELGKQLSFADGIILIGECSAIYQGLKEKNYEDQKIQFVKTMKKALAIMKEQLEEGDTLLIENDIPDVLMNT